MQEQANLQLKIGMDQELSEKHYVYKQARVSERKMYEQKLYGEKVLQEERQKYELQMVEKSTEVKMLREAKEELKAQLEQERKRFDQHLLEQSVKKVHLRSVPQPIQRVNPLTPTPSYRSEDTAEEKLSSDVNSALRSSRDQLREPAELHKKPKGPPVKPKSWMKSAPTEKHTVMSIQSPLAKPGLAERVMKHCSCDTKVKPLTYILDLTPDKSKGKLIEKYTFGPKPKTQMTYRVLMIFGVTGTGISTLINGMINYIFGVCWEDKFHFKMVVEDEVSQAESRTQKITAYTIYHQEGSPIDYTLTIVNTPGFSSTRGLESDKRMISQIRDFLSLSPSEGGVDCLHAIGFVMQASLTRLTQTQWHIFDSILSVFGKDLADNTFMMITFADRNKPPVVDALKAANIPFRRFFKFNNPVMYSHSEQMQQDTFDSSGEEGEGGDFNRMFWDMGMKRFEKFFTHFKVVEPQSLQLTNEVLKETQRLETTINSFQPQINERLAKIEELQHKEQILKQHESDMLTNKDFKYTVTLTKQRKVNLNPGHYVTNCLVCNYTCHEDCIYSNDDMWQCSATMDGGDINTASCRVCPGGGCHWTQHVNNPYRFELYQEDEERTQEDLRHKYVRAKEGMVQVQAMIKTINNRLSQLDEHVMEMIDQVRQSAKRLGEIALKPNPLTEVEYIDLLIESEKQEAKPGYQARIKYFQDVRKRAQLATEVLGIPTPAGRRGSEAHTSLWTSIRNLW